MNFWKSCDVFELQRGILATRGRTVTQKNSNNKGKLLTQIMEKEEQIWPQVSGLKWFGQCPLTLHLSGPLPSMPGLHSLLLQMLLHDAHQHDQAYPISA